MRCVEVVGGLIRVLPFVFWMIGPHSSSLSRVSINDVKAYVLCRVVGPGGGGPWRSMPYFPRLIGLFNKADVG